MPQMNMLQAVHRALEEEMERDAGAPDEHDTKKGSDEDKQGSGLPTNFSLEQMLRDGEKRAEEA